jgi:hypothetical protein
MAQILPSRDLVDAWVWTLAGFLAVISLSLPGYLQLSADRQATFLISGGALFLSGAAMGWLRPVRVWRWPLASLLAFLIWDVLRAARQPGFPYPIEAGAVVHVLLSSAIGDGLFTVPVLLGAFAGATMMRSGMD